MSPEAVKDAEVDVCTSCGGIWVDWFDGEIRKVARTVLASQRASRPSMGAVSEGHATGACPRCLRQLVAERYVVRAPEGDHPTGATLLRCEECAGAYVSRNSAELLATLSADDPPPPSVDGDSPVLTVARWGGFANLVKLLTGG